MWTCKKCSKPVYFAERIQSLGFDWHPSCLVCKECGKKLHPGQHAEHAAEPFCHHPCYAALFGPRIFGHGTRNECHGAFGKVSKGVDAERIFDNGLSLDRNVRLTINFLTSVVNGRLVLEGILRVYWAVDSLIYLKQEDETGSRLLDKSPLNAATRDGVLRSRSNTSVNSGPPSDDSDEEPLWRDESPVSTARRNEDYTEFFDGTPGCSGNSSPNALSSNSSPARTPHPNWPPTPYPTLRPSSSNTKLASAESSSPHMITSGSLSKLDGPQNSPVLSYTHNAPPHTPISYPLMSVNATDDCNSIDCGAAAESEQTVLGYDEQNNFISGDFDCECEIDPQNATIKTRTVKRRKDNLQTQSMFETLTIVNSEFYESLDKLHSASSYGDANSNFSDMNPSVQGVESNIPEVKRSESLHEGAGLATSSTLKRANSSTAAGVKGLVKRVSFSQVDWCEKLKDCDSAFSSNGSIDYDAARSCNSSCNSNNNKSGKCNEGRRTPPSKGKAMLRRRPGRRMDKKKVKRRCSINGHLYLRETSSFHLDADCPPAVVRVSSLTTTSQLITTILEKYKIEMSSANFALYVVKDNGEQRRMSLEESPLTTRVLLGPHDSIARLVLCDANTTTEITPEMAEFLHLSLTELRAILLQYEQEEQKQVRAVRQRYDEMRICIQFWLSRADTEHTNGCTLDV